jgi:hypothetical protein
MAPNLSGATKMLAEKKLTVERITLDIMIQIMVDKNNIYWKCGLVRWPSGLEVEHGCYFPPLNHADGAPPAPHLLAVVAAGVCTYIRLNTRDSLRIIIVRILITHTGSYSLAH